MPPGCPQPGRGAQPWTQEGFPREVHRLGRVAFRDTRNQSLTKKKGGEEALDSAPFSRSGTSGSWERGREYVLLLGLFPPDARLLAALL